MKKKILIEGMSCAHCVARVEKAFQTQEGVKEVKVDLEGKNAIVELTKELSDQTLKEIVEDAGYDVVNIERL